jgi:hypothetical protein
MIDVITALKAKLPFIGVHYDDPVNVRAVLQALSGKPVAPLPVTKHGPITDATLWWVENLDLVTTDNYRKLCGATATAIVINPEKPSPLIYDAGSLPTPDSFYRGYLQEFVPEAHMPPILHVLKGLSLKTAQEVVQLTMARCGSMQAHEIRKTRQMMGGEHPGLTTLDTDYDFYEWPKPLKEWLDLNDKYFLNTDTPAQLIPRGLLLAGEPGVGKSMASKVLAKHWDIPLFRLDVSTSLNRYLGESESRIARNLSLIEQNAPCVWLLDEAEKLFGVGGDEGTTRRILSQILWWLQSHKARVLTLMTTNDLPALPKELYRAERLDKVIHIEKLQLTAAKTFASKVYQSVLEQPPPMKRLKLLRDTIEHTQKSTFAHAEIRVLVYELIKSEGWLNGD